MNFKFSKKADTPDNSLQTYSFTKSRKKHLLSEGIRFVLFFFALVFTLLPSTYFFLLYKTNSFKESTVSYTNRASDFNKSILQMSQDIDYISAQAAQAENVFTNNSIIKDSIHNLFDLVPDKIVLSHAELNKYSLMLQGRTPTKEMYNFRLHAPLQSLFHESFSSFYPAENGWYFFVSKNYLNKTEEQE